MRKKSLPPFGMTVINKKKSVNGGLTRGGIGKKKIRKCVISVFNSHRGSKVEFFLGTGSEKKNSQKESASCNFIFLQKQGVLM
jgi:hypothetical protein